MIILFRSSLFLFRVNRNENEYFAVAQIMICYFG